MVGKGMWVTSVQLHTQGPSKGLAFAVLSSVHPVFGLYGSLFPAIIYAVFGMGRHVSTGTFALTSLISANAVERLVPLSSQNLTAQSNTSVLGLSDFEMQRISVAAAVSFLGGVIQLQECQPPALVSPRFWAPRITSADLPVPDAWVRKGIKSTLSAWGCKQISVPPMKLQGHWEWIQLSAPPPYNITGYDGAPPLFS
ncbi:hypothetical protein CB1_009595001 [Camelus ferus]|nr:hypothetical protein CB1_009595001 [Camelus ferus]